jgi:hypothetical protein
MPVETRQGALASPGSARHLGLFKVSGVAAYYVFALPPKAAASGPARSRSICASAVAALTKPIGIPTSIPTIAPCHDRRSVATTVLRGRRKGALRNIAELSDDEAAALAAVEVSEIFEGRGEDRRLIGYMRKVRFWDKRAALELAMHHLGLLKERTEHSGEMKIARTIVHVTRSEVRTLDAAD